MFSFQNYYHHHYYYFYVIIYVVEYIIFLSCSKDPGISQRSQVTYMATTTHSSSVTSFKICIIGNKFPWTMSWWIQAMVLEKHINVTGIELQCTNTSQMSEIKRRLSAIP